MNLASKAGSSRQIMTHATNVILVYSNQSTIDMGSFGFPLGLHRTFFDSFLIVLCYIATSSDCKILQLQSGSILA